MGSIVKVESDPPLRGKPELAWKIFLEGIRDPGRGSISTPTFCKGIEAAIPS